MNPSNDVRISVKFIIVANLLSNLKVRVFNLIKINNTIKSTNGINK